MKPDAKYEFPWLMWLERYFMTRGGAKRHRKTVLQQHSETYWSSESSAWDDSEAERERKRILASFGTREPARLGDDFIARWARFNDGGTATRRKIKRELKKQRKASVK